MPELIVTCRELRYAGKAYLRGERFAASDKDAKILKAIKKAADAPEPAPVRRVSSTRPLPVAETVEPAPAVEAEAEPAPRRRRSLYSTRALTAED